MAQTHTDINVNQLIINKLTKQEYNNLQQVSDTELYLVEEQVDSVVTQNSTNPIQSGAVYEALQDIGGTINDGTTTFTKNNETIGTTSANQENNKTIAIPNDVVMCNLIENKVLASYANHITRLKYIEDHGWVDMDRSNIQYNEGTGEWTGTFVSLDITEGEYYYDMDNDTVFVADENSEMQDVTSTVIIQGDANKLYCDTNTNILYRYDGSDFVALTSNFSGSYNDLSNKPLSVESSKVKYTLSDGTTKLTLVQESDLATIAFSGKSLDSPDFYFLKPDYKHGIIIADITDAYTASSSTVNLPYQGFNGTVIFSREAGNVDDTCAQITCCISYKSNYIRLYTNNPLIRPQIRTSNNRYYFCINSSSITAGRFYLYGAGRNLTTFKAFDNNSYTLVQDCYNITNSAEIIFPSSAVSGNISSGETLAVMMKKIYNICEQAQYRYFGTYNTQNGSLAAELKRIKTLGYTNGIIYVLGEVGIAGSPYNSTCIVEFFDNQSLTNAMMLRAKKSGSSFEAKVGYLWLNTNNEPTWGYENVGTVTYSVESGLTYNSVVCRLVTGIVIFQFYELQLNNGDMPDFSKLFTLSGISASMYSYGIIVDTTTGQSNTLYFTDTNTSVCCRGGITQGHKYTGHIAININ